MPLGYFHVVFTLPAEVADITFRNKAAVYDLLFKAASETMLMIAADRKHLGARIGITAVLHTWGSAMTHHPPVHMIVPSGGIALEEAAGDPCTITTMMPPLLIVDIPFELLIGTCRVAGILLGGSVFLNFRSGTSSRMEIQGKLRILILGQHAPSILNFRGPFIRDLVSAGHKVMAIAPLSDLSPQDRESVCRELEAFGVELHPVDLARTSLGPINDFAYLRAIRAKIRELKPDRIMAYAMKPIVYGGLAARSLCYPHFYALFAGLGYSFSESLGLRARTLRKMVTTLLKLALAQSRATIFQNVDDQNLLRSLGVLPKDKPSIVVAGSGVDLAHFAPSVVETPPEAPVFLMVSRILVDKGIREYVAAARKLKSRYPGARFQLLGAVDPGNPASPSKEEVASWRAVEHLGSTRDVRPFLKAASVFVLPSFYREGIPRSALEALATGRPVVTTDHPGCRETVEDGVNGFLVPTRDSTKLTEAMERFIKDPDLCVQMGKASLALARRRFDVNTVNADMLRVMDVPTSTKS